MFYEKRLTIPKNTSQASPVTTAIEVHPGLVKQVSIYFPPGCAALAHIQVYYWEHQVWPSNPNSDFTGDDTLVVFPENLVLFDPPYEFTILGWNDDDTYPHTPIVRFQIDADTTTIKDLIDFLGLGPKGPPGEPPEGL